MSDNDNVKRKMLATLFALCPKGAEASDGIDVYLQACRKIPDTLFVSAIASLMETWEWPNPPLPGDIRKRAQELRRAHIRRQRERRKRRELEGARENAMTPEEAGRLLADLRAQPLPARPRDQVAKKFQEHALERVLRRDDTPQIAGGEGA